MREPIEYLEAAKIDEVAGQLEAEGYIVVRQQRTGGRVYDLVATKGEQKIAVEVKARSALSSAAKQLRALREQAYRQGFTEFRLIVTNPPHETQVEIDGLHEQLFRYMIKHPPESLVALAVNTRVIGVSGIEIDTVYVSAGEVSVAGAGVVGVQLESGEDTPQDDADWTTDFPFTFSVRLNRALMLETVEELAVDTSGFQD
jgi:hypothetical protein